MTQQKLYTEEQVKDMLELTNLNVQFHIDTMIPIELPSDEEILEATPYTPVDANSYKLGLKYGFRDGAHWMKEQILGKEDKTFKQKSKWTEVDNMTRRLK